MLLKALIADDEPVLRQAMKNELDALMPEMAVVAEFGDGFSTLEWLQNHSVDVAFLDIRMPGLTGLEVADSLLRAWPEAKNKNEFAPLVVFVTAYDEYAVKAFDTEAVDYLLKPVTPDRLQQTIVRLKQRLEERAVQKNSLELETKLKNALNRLSDRDNPDNSLRSIRASVGDQIRLIPIEEVVLFQAEHKYVNVYTENLHALIREPLKDLLPRLPTEGFVQIHRSSIVNMAFVEAADRKTPGRMTLRLRGTTQQPAVSRSFRHLFKAM